MVSYFPKDVVIVKTINLNSDLFELFNMDLIISQGFYFRGRAQFGSAVELKHSEQGVSVGGKPS